MLIFVGVLLLLSLIVFHEWGHFWAARRAGIEVEEFGVGFPPRAKILAKKNGTIYSLNWLPLGGFVKLKGEHDSDTTPGSFGAARLREKVLVMVAGVAANLIAAIVILSVVAAVGLPKVLDNQFSVASDTKIVQQDVIVSYIAPDSPASKASDEMPGGGDGAVIKLEEGDKLRIISDFACGPYEPAQVLADPSSYADMPCPQRITDSDSLREATSSLAAQDYENDVVLTVERDGQLILMHTKLLSKNEVEASQKTDDPKGYLGVVPSDYVVQRATWSAPIVGTVVSGQIVVETFRGLGNVVGDLFRGDASTAKDNVTGVVGIGYLLGELSKQGFMSVLLLSGIISLSLAVMNILPIPALDGGRLFVTLLFRVLKRPLSKETEERIHGTGFALLMLLFVLITVLDVQRFVL